MTCNKLVRYFLLFLIIFRIGDVFAQAPNISYPSPQIYTQFIPIPPLTATNTGGIVPDGQVTTLSGTGGVGSANGPGVVSTYNSPVGVAVDGQGDVFVADNLNSLIRELFATGFSSTLAGTGSIGNSNNSTGTQASFNAPFGVTVDQLGNVFVADEGNNLIREISPTGVVTTFAGSGQATSSNNIKGLSASFNHPYGIAVDGLENIYIAEGASNLIRKITAQRVVTTLAGNGGAGWADGQGNAAMFNNPQGIAVDAIGNIYVADSKNNRIRKITPGGLVTTIAGSGAAGFQNGPAGAASFNFPYGLAVDLVGNVYVSDQRNNVIRKINSAGIVSTLAGTGAAGANDGVGIVATFDGPSQLAIDGAGNLYVADAHNNKIRKVITTGFVIDKALPAGLKFDPTTGTITGTPTVVWPATLYTITAYNTSGVSKTTVIISVSPADNFVFNPLTDKSICDADFDPGATASSSITYTSNNPAVATIVANKIHITGVGTATITGTDGLLSSTQILTVDAAATPTITISPALLDTCSNIPLTFSASVTDGGPTPSYQWQVNGQNQGANSPQFITSNLSNGDKITCTLTSDATCITIASVTSAPALFTVYQPANVSVIIKSSARGGVICQGTTAFFTATPFTPDISPFYQWQINGINQGKNSPVFSTNALADGDVVTCIISTNSECSVNLNVLSNPIPITLSAEGTCLIVIPNAFSPNGDGVNDLWDITDLQGYPGCTVAIYDRYGALIYRSIGYPKAWDGTLNGKALPGGTYYYVIDPKNGKRSLAGYVTIVR